MRKLWVVGLFSLIAAPGLAVAEPPASPPPAYQKSKPHRKRRDSQ
jgi:hypothetical protein